MGPLLIERTKVQPPSIIDHDSGPLDVTLDEEKDHEPVTPTTGDEHVTGSGNRGKKKSRRHSMLIEESTASVLDAMPGKWE